MSFPLYSSLREFVPSQIPAGWYGVFLALTLSLFVQPTYAQVWGSIDQTGSNEEDHAREIALDGQGGLFMVGMQWEASFDGFTTGTLGPWPFLAKFDLYGNTQWVITPGQTALNVSSDPAGNIYVVGGAPTVKLQKYNTNGNLIWEKLSTYNSGLACNIYSVVTDDNSVTTIGGHYSYDSTAIGSTVLPTPDLSDLLIAQYDGSGNPIWAKHGSGIDFDFIYGMAQNPQGEIFITGESRSDTITIDTFQLASTGAAKWAFLIKLSPSGDVIWGTAIGNSLTETSGIEVGVDSFGNSFVGGHRPLGTGFISKFDSSGALAWQVDLQGGFSPVRDIYTTPNGETYFTGHYQDSLFTPQGFVQAVAYEDLFMGKIDQLGSLLWLETANGGGSNLGNAIAVNAQNQVFVAGGFSDTTVFGTDTLVADSAIGFFRDIYLSTLADTSFTSNKVSGKVFFDTDSNCVQAGNELDLSGFMVKAEPGPTYAITNSLGEYSLFLDTGQYTISQIIPQTLDPYMSLNCPAAPGTFVLQLDSFNIDTTGFDFANIGELCPVLEVEVASNIRRRCFTSLTTVQYANSGFDTAYNVEVVVKYPDLVVPITSSLTYTYDNDSNLVFAIGNLNPGQSGSIQLTDSVICTTVDHLGLAACTEVWINPQNTCLPPNVAWDGSEVAVQSTCLNDSVVGLTIKNPTVSDMTNYSEYRVYKNGFLILTDSVQLLAGDSLDIQVNDPGQTIRLEVDQSPFHPQNEWVSTTLEACGYNVGYNVTKGFVVPYQHQFPEADRDIDCMTIIGAYDPNDKAVFPEGTIGDHYVKPGVPLTYRIRFQNTGNDTAFNIHIIDELSPNLDPSTLQPGPSSFPYTLSMDNFGGIITLTFEFDNIMLVDSFTNEPASHGFVEYTIMPDDSLAPKTLIENKAGIYFDFNPPIITNTVFTKIFDTTTVLLDSSIVQICTGNPTVSNLGADTSLCETSSFQLQGNQPFIGNGSWDVLLGTGILVDPFDSSTVANGLSYGSNDFVWTIDLCGVQTKDTVRIVRNEPPQPPSIDVATDSSICQGDSVILTGPAGFDEYTWSNGSISMFTAIHQTGSIGLTVTDTNGCSSSFQRVVTVIDLPVPFAPIVTLSGPSVICPGDSTMLQGPSGWDGYLWSDNSSDSVLTVYQAGDYSLQVVDSNGCISNTSVPTSVTEWPIPNNPSIEHPGADSLRSSEEASTYIWLLDGSVLPGSFRTIFGASFGRYELVIVDSNGCASDTSLAFERAVGMLDLPADEMVVRLYPNPTSGQLYVDTSFPISSDQLEMYSLLGERLNVLVNERRYGTHFEIHTTTLSTGLYLLKITTGGQSLAYPVQIIQH